jgi:hypothetical protein
MGASAGSDDETDAVYEDVVLGDGDGDASVGSWAAAAKDTPNIATASVAENDVITAIA